MEFQVDPPMKPNLKPDLVFSPVHFPVGAIHGRRCNAIYSVKISESVIECWPSGRLVIQAHHGIGGGRHWCVWAKAWEFENDAKATRRAPCRVRELHADQHGREWIPRRHLPVNSAVLSRVLATL
jgi:hypothetical protein